MQRAPLLVVLHSDGWAEAYAERQLVDIRMVLKPHASTPQEGIAAERHVEQQTMGKSAEGARLRQRANRPR